MAQPTQEEVERSAKVRPAVQARITRENLSVSAAARAMESNPETVRQFLGDRTATGANLEMFERWAAGGDGGTRYTDTSDGTPSTHNAEWLPRLLELVLTGDVDGDRLELVRQINAAARMQNALWESAAAYRRAGAMEVEGLAAGARAIGIEEEAKSASVRALTLKPESTPAVPTTTPPPTAQDEGETGEQDERKIG